MTTTKIWLTYFWLASFCLVAFDQALKRAVITHPNFSIYLIKPWIGIELFKNPGVAFGLPLPNWLLVVGTPILLFFLGWQLYKKLNHPKSLPLELFGYILVIAGALSNYYDRFVYEITVDYLRLLYSVINLADVMIIMGLLFVVKPNLIHVDKAD